MDMPGNNPEPSEGRSATAAGDENTIVRKPGAGGVMAKWTQVPLYARIVIAMVLGAIIGFAAKGGTGDFVTRVIGLKEVSGLILDLLKALATPLILLAILNALLRTEIGGKQARRMAFYLITNTMAAIAIGLLVANVVRPGTWGGDIGRPAESEAQRLQEEKKPYEPFEDIKSKIPTNIIRPLATDNVIAVIILGLTFGIAIRKVRKQQREQGVAEYKYVEGLIATLFQAVMTALFWIIQLVPIAVFCVVAAVIAEKGFEPFKSLGGFIVAVLLALSLQVAFYLSRVTFGSWVSPIRFLTGGKEALLTAFSTASSTVAMPITYNALRDRDKIGLREQSASMGALVGSNFNNDGTALYEAMAPLFIAQAIGQPLPLTQQVIIAFMAVVASVGAAGIPEAGLVTMLLVFKAVDLNTAYVLLILPVDWFLDRCRTAVNIMGDMTVGCLLDGKIQQTEEERAAEEALLREKAAAEPNMVAGG
ncbi:MAG: hypothetical protein OHK0029_09430 [Armatimonadaceae bacterium]